MVELIQLTYCYLFITLLQDLLLKCCFFAWDQVSTSGIESSDEPLLMTGQSFTVTYLHHGNLERSNYDD